MRIAGLEVTFVHERIFRLGSKFTDSVKAFLDTTKYYVIRFIETHAKDTNFN